MSSLINEMYDQIKTDTPNIEKIITPEALPYYIIAILWLRIIEIRLEAKEILTETERTLRL